MPPEKNVSPSSSIANAPFRLLAGLLLVFTPIFVFYFALVRASINLPDKDDYDVVLGFMDSFVSLHGFHNKLVFVLTAQSNEYKLFFQFLIYITAHTLTGKLNFIFLQQLGNAFVLLTGIVLWCMFRPHRSSLDKRLLLFAPAVLILFSPRYSETLNWTMAGLQNLPILFFSLLSLYLIDRNTPRSFVAAVLSLILAISSSGNGFFLGCLGLLFLFQQRQILRALAWTATIFLMGALYFYHYRVVSGSGNPSLQHPLLTISAFPLVFIGSCAGVLPLCFLLATMMFVVGLVLSKNGWRLRDPATFYAAMFVILTAIGVAITRHDLGLRGAMAYRYSLYSQLLIALLYMAVIRLNLTQRVSRKIGRASFAAFLVSTLIYCVLFNARQPRSLRVRSTRIISHYIAWKNNPQGSYLVPDEMGPINNPLVLALEKGAPESLIRAEKLGIYQPPSVESLLHMEP